VVDVKSRHVAVSGSAIRVYCSAACLQGTGSLDPIVPVAGPPRRARWLIGAGVIVGGTFILLARGSQTEEPASGPATQHGAFVLPVPAPVSIAAPTPAASVPDDKQRIEDDKLLVDLMQDAWIHPLAGPKRRMPINHTAAFGAERDGQRPPECASGHCGVDVGGSIWGEPVHAVHDGVVDWVNRGPNDEHGGIFVKIAHRGGTLYSWYFHLAAVPRWIRPGAKITAGQVIGLVGDTGVKNSGPHLHFSMTVKPSKEAHERYLDPEPLIAIWPLWIADETRATGHLSMAEPPGMPVRAPARAKPEATSRPAVDSGSGAEAGASSAPASVSTPSAASSAAPQGSGAAPISSDAN
jgi:murein DD-endopeptidase MepM/ murein hydrolase activator NlpD